MPELDGRNAVVTGAGRGLGQGIAKCLATHGAQVAVLDLDPAAAEATAELIRGRSGRAWSSGMDVTDEVAVRRTLESARERLGVLDLVVNCAGILTVGHVVELEPADWRRVLEVNATGVFLVSQAAVRLMIRDRREGSIISVASIAGKIGEPGLSHYAASKFAVVGFTQALAREVAEHGITVNAVCPGVVVTPMIEELSARWGASLQELVGRQAIHRPQTPDEVAAAVMFLHANRSITGQALNVDGGTVFS